MNGLFRLLIWVLAVALALLPVIGVLNGWFAANRWPIEQLGLRAEFRRVDEAAIREALLPHVGAGFFAVDLGAVHDAVAALDWVAKVEVRKRWPNRLEITVIEHQPFARWGEQHLLSAQGQLFPRPHEQLPEGLPLFEGSRERLADIAKVFQAVQPLFVLHGDQLAAVRLSARGSWTFRSVGGATVMAGRGEPVARLQRFMPLLTEVRNADGRALLRADLRYANGFALRWQEPVDPATGAAPTDNGSDT